MTHTFWSRILGSLFLTWVSTSVLAADVTDDTGHVVSIDGEVQRIITLAPHLAEIVFAVGAGEKLIGVSDWTDYPQAASAIERVGDNQRLDFERIVSLAPDLVVAWGSGNRSDDIARLRELGLQVYVNAADKPEDIARNLIRFGSLLGTTEQATLAAEHFKEKLADLAVHTGPPVRVFFQLWNQPLMTINRKHIISDIVHRCGGVNVFGTLPQLVPVVSTEAVIQEKPDLIVSTNQERSTLMTQWQRFTSLPAVQRGGVAVINSDNISRMGPRFVDGAQELCKLIERTGANIDPG